MVSASPSHWINPGSRQLRFFFKFGPRHIVRNLILYDQLASVFGMFSVPDFTQASVNELINVS